MLVLQILIKEANLQIGRAADLDRESVGQLPMNLQQNDLMIREGL